MKLRNIYILCRDNMEFIDKLVSTDISTPRLAKKVTGWKNCKKALLMLQDVPSLRQESNELLKAVPDVFVMEDSFVVSELEWDRIHAAKKMLYRTLEDTVDLYEKMGLGDAEEQGVDIKLPQTRDFSEFAKYISDLEFVFSKCPFFQDENEHLEFDSVDVGSTWITLLVAGVVAVDGVSNILKIIAAFVDQSIILKSHLLSLKAQKHDLEKSERDENQKKIILEYIESLYKAEVDKAISIMEEKADYTVLNQDGDERLRIEQCFEKMGGLIDKGLQIYSTIDAPKEVKLLFDPIKPEYKLVSEKLNLLEKKEDENSETS